VPIQAHRPFGDHPWPSPQGKHGKRGDEFVALLTGKTLDNLKARIPQLSQPPASGVACGICGRHHHSSHACSDHGRSTRGRFPVMAARFQADHERAALGSKPRLSQGYHFRVRPTEAGVPALAYRGTGGIKHHRPHHGIGLNQALAATREFECSLHRRDLGVARAHEPGVQITFFSPPSDDGGVPPPGVHRPEAAGAAAAAGGTLPVIPRAPPA
jgi:hypothetical protein